MTVVRSMGLFGSVWVSYHTEGRTAISGQDFGQSSGRLFFRPGEASKVIILTILDDNLSEGPEEFFLNITLVELLNARLNSAFTLKSNCKYYFCMLLITFFPMHSVQWILQ